MVYGMHCNKGLLGGNTRLRNGVGDEGGGGGGGGGVNPLTPLTPLQAGALLHFSGLLLFEEASARKVRRRSENSLDTGGEPLRVSTPSGGGVVYALTVSKNMTRTC